MIQVKGLSSCSKPPEIWGIPALLAPEGVEALCFKLDSIDFHHEEEVDLMHWTDLLGKLDEYLAEHTRMIQICGETKAIPSEENENKSKVIVLSILRFLRNLLKGCSKNKKYFQSFEHVGKLFRAYDLEMVEMAVSVIFHACLPSVTSSSSVMAMESDTRDGVEAIMSIADDALTIFEGLGLLSADYGILDYLRGHYPELVNQREQHLLLKFTIPCSSTIPTEKGRRTTIMSGNRSTMDATVKIAIDGESRGFLRTGEQRKGPAIQEELNQLLLLLGQPPILIGSPASSSPVESPSSSSSQEGGMDSNGSMQLSLLSVLRGVDGLRGNRTQRIRVICLRAQCLLLVAFSRSPPDRLAPYLRAGGVVWKDVLALSDISSEAFAELDLGESTISLSMVTLFLQVTLGLFENARGRRGPSLPPILAELGLSRNAIHDGGENSYAVPWVSIVVAATAGASGLFADVQQGQMSVLDHQEHHQLSHDHDVDDVPLGLAPWRGGTTKADFHAEYAVLALELFASCLTMREGPVHGTHDTPVVGAVVGLAQAAVEPIKALLSSLANAAVGITPDPLKTRQEDVRLLRPAAKTLSALEVCFTRNGYNLAFRECGGLAPVTAIVESFGANADLLPPSVVITACDPGVIKLRTTVKHVLENASSLLCCVVDNARRGVVMNNTETGVHVLHQQCFARLCTAIFSSSYCDHHVLWVKCLHLIRSAITAEPPFLAQFLESTYIGALTKALKKNLDDPLMKSTNDGLILPLLKLAASMCITADGQNYVVNNRMIPFVVDALLHPSQLLPRTKGVAPETTTKCGRILMQIAKECEVLRQPIRSAIVSNLTSISVECRRLWKALPAQDESTLNSPRMQVLQRLTNLCLVVESMGTETRRHSNEFLKDVFTENVIESLVKAYPCSLPPARQLFAQLSMRHTHNTFLYYGYCPAAKALTSVLKIAANIAPTHLLPVLFRVVDETLGLISASKTALRAFSVRGVGDQSPLLQGSSSGGASSVPLKKIPSSGGKLKGGGSRDRDLAEQGTLATYMGSLAGGSGNSRSNSYRNSSNVHDEEDHDEDNDWESISGANLLPNTRRRSRSRGSSFGQSGANVMMLGVLDCIPHRCAFDADFLDSTEFANAAELETHIWKFQCSTLNLVWLTSMLSHGLKPMQRAQGQSLIAAGKDVFRRMFAYMRSSMLEVCRFSSSKWAPKALTDSRVTSNCQGAMAEYDSTEDGALPLLRVPQQYVLRVVHSAGALIRENCEIEGSREVFTATAGSLCAAYERSETTQGVTRYRTAHGWLSEYRRDQNKDPIIEIMAITPCRSIGVVNEGQTPLPLPHHPNGETDAKKWLTLLNTVKVDPNKRKWSEALTLRESTSMAMVRVHANLRQVASYLARLCHTEPTSVRLSRPALSGAASILSGSLSKIFRSFLTHPFSCLQEGESPRSLLALSMNSGGLLLDDALSPLSLGDEKSSSGGVDNNDDLSSASGFDSPAGKKSGGMYPSGSSNKKSRRNSNKALANNDVDSKSNHSTSTNSAFKSPPGSSSKYHSTSAEKGPGPGEEGGDEDETMGEALTINRATLCLYMGAVVRNILLPVLEDRNGHLNTYLIRALSAHGAIDAFLDALVFVQASLNDAIMDIGSKGGLALSVGTGVGSGVGSGLAPEAIIGSSGRCALHALPQMFQMIRKLVQRELYIKSPVTTSMTDLIDEIGTFHMHDLLYQILSATSSKLLPIFQRRLLTMIPPELQQDWLTIVGELVSSLTVPLPLPTTWGTAFTVRYTSQGEVMLKRNESDGIDLPPAMQASAGSSSGAASSGSASASASGLRYRSAFERDSAAARSDGFLPSVSTLPRPLHVVTGGSGGGSSGPPPASVQGIASTTTSSSSSSSAAVDVAVTMSAAMDTATAVDQAQGLGSRQPSSVDPLDDLMQSYLQGMGFVREDISTAIAATRSNQLDIVMDYLLNHPNPTPTPSSAPPSSSPPATSSEGPVPSTASLATSASESGDNSPVPDLVESRTPGDSASTSPGGISSAAGGESGSGSSGARGGEDLSEFNLPGLVDESDSDHDEDNRNGRYVSCRQRRHDRAMNRMLHSSLRDLSFLSNGVAVATMIHPTWTLCTECFFAGYQLHAMI